MLPEVVLAKVEGATQATLLNSLAGNSYTVGQVTTSGNGLGAWLFLTPDGGSAAASNGAVALKLEGTNQLAQMSGLVGKSVTIGKAPTVVGGIGKWVVFYPKAAVLASGAAGVGASSLANSQIIMLKLEGTKFAAQAPFLAGKTFTVVKTTAAAAGTSKWLFLQPVGNATAVTKDIVAVKIHSGATQIPWLVGNTFTIGKTPIVAGTAASKYLVLHPVTGVVAKSIATTTMVAKSVTAARVVEGTAAKTLVPAIKTAGIGGTNAVAVAGKSATMMTAAKTAGTVGTIWNGTGMGLGLGLGLGVAGPLILGAIIAATGYGVYQYRKRIAAGNEADDSLA